MFKKDTNGSSSSFDTLVGVNTIFDGNIESEGTVRVDGKVKGYLKISGDVYVGPDAVIKGNIFGNNVHISGNVEGNVVSKGVLRILSTARLIGDINVHSFVADEGGIFQGKCHMIEAEAEVAATERPSVKKTRDYKKSSAISQLDDNEKATEAE